ncbi:MAG: transglycosylase SLT domain-containing protein [Chrysiogenetes bacterium]|nr:transglycosylase SLT domain-containing protein [Chrysiogenetes bacterium]
MFEPGISGIDGPLDWLKEKLAKPAPAKAKRDTSAYDALIRKYANRKDILPHYVKGMIHVESAFDPAAKGPSKEIGLMQFLPSTAKSLGYEPASLEDPETAIKAGTAYLAQIIDKTLAPNLTAPIHPVLKIKLAQFGYTAGPTFLKEILKRYGANAAVLSSPTNFDLMVDSLQGLPLTEKFEKLVPNFLSSRKQVVGRYQYWADRYAPDFGYSPAPAAPVNAASSMGSLGIGAAALVAGGFLLWRLKR